MAIAKVREVEKIRMVEEKYTETEGVTLELTEEETCYIAALIGWKVTGYDTEGVSIYTALRNAGYSSYKGTQPIREKVNGFRVRMHGHISMEEI